MAGDKKTNDLVNEIYNRISDLSLGNEDYVSVALALVSIRVMNSIHKPNLSAENVALIKENYPPATRKDIEERGLSAQGLAQGLGIFSHAAKIVLDYSPLTNAQAEQRQDTSDKSNQHKAQEVALTAYKEIKSAGFSSFGASTLMILVGTMLGLADSVSGFKLSRPLIESLGKVLEEENKDMGRSPEEIKAMEEMAISTICKQMQISRKEALRYLQAAKEMMSREEG